MIPERNRPTTGLTTNAEARVASAFFYIPWWLMVLRCGRWRAANTECRRESASLARWVHEGRVTELKLNRHGWLRATVEQMQPP